jgi:pilus assembly protein Flp/PilA
MLNKMKNLVVAEEGQGMTEYGLVLGVIAIAVVGVLVTMRTKIVGLFNNANDALDKATAANGDSSTL